LYLYTFFGYPFLLNIICILKNKKKLIAYGYNELNITIIIAVHNEERRIINRIENIMKCNYPKDKIEIIVVSDGSNDRTVSIVRDAYMENKNLKLIEYFPQKGRAYAHNLGVEEAKGEILFFTDADTDFDINYISNILKNYNNKTVGSVSGLLKWKSIENTSIAQSMGIYWKYETWMRRKETIAGMMTVGSGACISVRKDLYKPICETEDIDSVIPLNVIKSNYLNVSEESAIAYDYVTHSIIGEIKSRIRMVVIDISAYIRHKELLNPIKYSLISVSILSHKVLRWLSPYLFIVFVICGLMVGPGFGLYSWIKIGMILITALFILGYIFEICGFKVIFVSQLFGFIIANVGFMIGIWKYVFGHKISKWQKA